MVKSDIVVVCRDEQVGVAYICAAAGADDVRVRPPTDDHVMIQVAQWIIS